MTPHRYEIEFQGSNNGQTRTAYPFRFKPQHPNRAPGIYAPCQPRFDWNLWFASLGTWDQNPFVLRTRELLLENDQPVLSLFAADPFHNQPPRFIRTVLWQHWFSTREQKRREASGGRVSIGPYGAMLERLPDGRMTAIEEPSLNPPPD